MLNVLYYKVGEEAVLTPVEEGLKPLQALVGGMIETVTLSRGLILVCNEEGRLMGLPPNRYTVDYGVIVGDFFITASDEEGEFISLTDDQISLALTMLEGMKVQVA